MAGYLVSQQHRFLLLHCVVLAASCAVVVGSWQGRLPVPIGHADSRAASGVGGYRKFVVWAPVAKDLNGLLFINKT